MKTHHLIGQMPELPEKKMPRLIRTARQTSALRKAGHTAFPKKVHRNASVLDIAGGKASLTKIVHFVERLHTHVDYHCKFTRIIEARQKLPDLIAIATITRAGRTGKIVNYLMVSRQEFGNAPKRQCRNPF